MYPAYGYKNTYPHGRSQMSGGHPTSEGIPPQMKMETSNSPFVYETWPHHFGYPVPTQCHSCCSHNPYPGYYAYRPPYPHFPSPQPHPQCYGGYPLYPEPYPFHYAPPPHYTTDFSSCKYDMSMPREIHCCGCPQNKSHMEGDKSVKIEEQEPEAEKVGSLVPAGYNNLQKPVVWIPPDYMKHEERPTVSKAPMNFESASQDRKMWNGWNPLDLESIKQLLEDGDGKRSQDRKKRSLIKPQGKEAKDHQQEPVVMGPQQESRSDGEEPIIWNGWMPLDMDSIKRLLQNGDLKRDQDRQPSDWSRQLPHPVIWLSNDNGDKSEARNQREANSTSEASVLQPSNFNHIPVVVQQGDDRSHKTIPAVEAERNKAGTKPVEKSNNLVKIIPVKQMEEHANMKTENDAQGKYDKYVKNTEDNKISTDNGTKSKSSSPKKASKLPPVCLRVDPLPKKKNGKGNSRSPSPPRHEVQQTDAVKSPSPISENNVHENTEGPMTEAEKKSTELPEKKKEIEVVDISDRIANVEVGKPSNFGAQEASNVTSEMKDASEGEAKSQEGEMKHDEAFKRAPKILSGTEAAIIIQSAYRGYQVRRWEPLKKMREIANIRAEAAQVRRCIESSPSSMDPKQKAAIGETIMKLLLKLDTIQGLHPSIRDMRKSVAKELVSLQERLDTLEVKQSDHPPEKSTGAETTTLDVLSQNSGLDEAEDQQEGEREENQKDHIFNSKVIPGEESHTVSHLLPSEVTPDRACPDEGSKSDPHETTRGEEIGESLSASSIQQNESDVKEELATQNPTETSEAHGEGLESDKSECPAVDEAIKTSTEEESVKPAGCESSPVVAEVHLDSVDQTDIKNDLLAELPLAHSEEDVPQTTDNVADENTHQVNIESEMAQLTEAPVTECEKNEADKASKGKTAQLIDDITEAPVNEPKKHEADGEESRGEKAQLIEEGSEAPVAESEKHETDEEPIGEVLRDQDTKSVSLEHFCVPKSEQESDVSVVQPVTLESVHEESSPAKQAQEGPVQLSLGMAARLVDVTKPEFQEGEGPLVRVDAQTEEPVENPKKNEAGYNMYKENEPKNDVSQDTKASEQEDGSDYMGKEESERRIMEENEKMRDLLEKLIASGKQQEEVISSLNGKLKELESKLAKQKKKKTPRTRRAKVLMPRPCKTSKVISREVSMGVASLR